jgi:hypothetical protein
LSRFNLRNGGSLFALGVDAYVTIDLDLAGKAYVRILLEVIAQPESFLNGEGIRVCCGGNRYAVGTAQAVAVAVRKFPHAAVDWNIILKRWITDVIAFWDFYLFIFTHKCNDWHCSSLQCSFFVCRGMRK